MKKTLTIGNHKLDSPLLYASYRLGDYPTSGLKFLPWKMTNTRALLINAYNFTERKYRNWLNNGWCPKKYLDLGCKPILIDSGAYYFRKEENISITPQQVLEIELTSQADIGVVLDHPFPPDAKDKAKRINTTIKNTEIMLQEIQEHKTPMRLMPVIHGHSKRQLQACISKLKGLEDQYGYPLLRQVGIGSVAPLAQRGHATLAVEIIHRVRKELPTSQIHCFSMGSTLLMLLAFYSGADSVDSTSWIVSAGFKLAQLPGHYVVRMGKREYRNEKAFRSAMREFRRRLAVLAAEQGYGVKNWANGKAVDLKCADKRRSYVRSLIDLRSNEHVHNRACHNLWTLNFEVQAYRKAREQGKLHEFLESRLANSRYRTAFQLAKELKQMK